MAGLGLTRALLGMGLGLVMGVAVGCFIEPAQPSTFRFDCSADSECDADQICAEGLCQQPCGGDEDADCPGDAPICLNGYCSSLCPLDSEVCPAPQSCVELPAEFSGFGIDTGSSGVCLLACTDDSGCSNGEVCDADSGLCFPDFGSTGGEAGGDTEGSGDGTCATVDDCEAGQDCVMGFCATTCAMADECEAGQDCVMGYCVGTCMTADDCNPGEQCLGGFCIPG